MTALWIPLFTGAQPPLPLFRIEDFPGPNFDKRSYIAFGLPTLQMPRTGTGNYSGIALGQAKVVWLSQPNNVRHSDVYEMSGTSTLTANFSDQSFLLQVQNIGGERVRFSVDRGSSFQDLILPDISYSGGIQGSEFALYSHDRSSTNQLFGGSFGPGAAEFAAAFATQNYNAFGVTEGWAEVIGVAVGVKE